MKNIPCPFDFFSRHEEAERKEKEQVERLKAVNQRAQDLMMETAVRHLHARLAKEMERLITTEAWKKTSSVVKPAKGIGRDYKAVLVDVVLPVNLKANWNNYRPSAKALNLNKEEYETFKKVFEFPDYALRICGQLKAHIMATTPWKLVGVTPQKTTILVQLEARQPC